MYRLYVSQDHKIGWSVYKEFKSLKCAENAYFKYISKSNTTFVGIDNGDESKPWIMSWNRG